MKDENIGSIEIEEEGKFRKIKGDFGEVIGKSSEELIDLASYILISNKNRGKLVQPEGYAGKNFVIRVYEAEIPQYNPKTGQGAGFNTKTKDGKENLIVIDERLSPYQKLAVLTHQLFSVYDEREEDSIEKRRIKGHDAHLEAIDSLSDLYENYNRLEDKDGFDVTRLPKKEIGNAVAYLVSTRRDYGVGEEELQKRSQKLNGIGKELRGLESLVAAFVAIPCLVLAGLSFSTNLTGNAIANISTQTTSFIGVGLFIIGLISSLIYFKSKRRLVG